MGNDWPTDRVPSDLADTAYGLPVIYSAKVIDAVMSNLVCVGAVDTTWREQLRVGTALYIPVMDSLTANPVDVGTDFGGTSEAHMQREALTTGVAITPDQWYECPVQVSDGEALQTQIPDLIGKMAKRAGYEIAAVIDTEVNKQFESLTDDWIGSDGQTFSDDLLIALMEGLDEADVPRTERSLVVDPSCIADMYKIDKFVHKDYNMTLTGEIGRTPYGDTILVTNNLYAGSNANTGAFGALLHKDAIGAVIQMPPKVEKYRWAARHSDVINTSAIFGADVLRVTFGNQFYTRLA